MINVHPQRWYDTPLPWVKELVWQNLKNVVKAVLIRKRGRGLSAPVKSRHGVTGLDIAGLRDLAKNRRRSCPKTRPPRYVSYRIREKRSRWWVTA